MCWLTFVLQIGMGMGMGMNGAAQIHRRSSSTTPPILSLSMRGWRNTVEIILFEISNSMESYPSVVHAFTSKLRVVICMFEQKHIDEVSDRIPTTSSCPEVPEPRAECGAT